MFGVYHGVGERVVELALWGLELLLGQAYLLGALRVVELVGGQLFYELNGEFFVLEDGLGVLTMLFQHLLVICLINHCHDLLLVGLDILPYLLQQEDILTKLLFLLLNTAKTCLLPTVELLEVLFYAELDGCFDLFVMLLEV